MRSGRLGAARAGGRRGLAGHRDDRGERRLVGHRQISEDLAVHLHTRELQALDEAVVRHAVGASRGVDPGDPQLAEVTLAVPPVPVRVLQRVQHLLLRLAVQARALPAVPAGVLQYGTALLLGVHRPLHACHVCLLPLVGGARQRPSSFRMRLVSALLTSSVPDMRRVTLDDFFSRLWRLPVGWARILPPAVTLTRFPMPVWLFIFGIAFLPYHRDPPLPGPRY